VIGEVRGDVGHALAAAARTEAATFAAERHEALELAVAAAKAREAVGKHAALQEGSQFLFYEPRVAGAILRLCCVAQEGREVLLQDAVQHAGFGIAPRVGCARARVSVRMRAG
jgi:hypothetical protein